MAVPLPVLLKATPSIMLYCMHDATTREIVVGVLDRLPQDATLEQVARELEFIAGVREGFAQIDRGEGVPLEEIERQLPTWTRTNPPESTK